VIAALRRAHRRAFIGLAVLLPVAVGYALAGKRRVPSVGRGGDAALPGGHIEQHPVLGLDLVSHEDQPPFVAWLAESADSDTGARSVVVNVPDRVREDPTLVLYFTCSTAAAAERTAADAPRAAAVPQGSARLGAWHLLRGLASGVPALTPPGTLWLCSARDGTVIAVDVSAPEAHRPSD
jgi:hypothetical protein